MIASMFLLLASNQASVETTARSVSPPVPIPVRITPQRPLAPNQRAMPLGNPGSWATSADYPIDALISKTNGISGFRLTINRWGMVADCVITATSGSTRLDDETCRLVAQRARFSPATDAESNPISDQYSNRINWVIPVSTRVGNLDEPVKRRELPPPFAEQAGWMQYTFDVDMSGAISNCSKTGEGAQFNKPVSLCDLHAQKIFPQTGPYRDAEGKPVARRVTLKSSVEITPLTGAK